jgi:hypothetical protein
VRKRAKTAEAEVEFMNILRAKDPDADMCWTTPEVTVKATEVWNRPAVRRIIDNVKSIIYICFAAQSRATLAVEAGR